MKIGAYQIGVNGKMGYYDCAVEEIYNNGETYYKLEIKSPYENNNGTTPARIQIEMHFDSDTGGLKINDPTTNLPDDILEIEGSLSDLICGIHS